MKKENYGFLRMRGGGKMLFFHTNNITIEGRPMFLRREESLSEAVPVGQEVEFSLPQALVDLRDDDFARIKQKPAAQNVVMLQREEVPADSELRIEGTVSREVRGSKRNRHEGYGGVIKYIPSGGEGGDEVTAETGGQGEASGGDGVDGAEVEVTAASKFIEFEGSDLHADCPVLRVGDKVNFLLKQNSLAVGPRKRAHDVLIVRPTISSGLMIASDLEVPVPLAGGGSQEPEVRGWSASCQEPQGGGRGLASSRSWTQRSSSSFTWTRCAQRAWRPYAWAQRSPFSWLMTLAPGKNVPNASKSCPRAPYLLRTSAAASPGLLCVRPQRPGAKR